MAEESMQVEIAATLSADDAEAVVVEAVGLDTLLRGAASAIEPYDMTDDEAALLDEGHALTIRDADTFRRGGEILVEAKRISRKIEDRYGWIKKPINALRALVLEMEKADGQPWVTLIDRLVPAVTAYDKQQKVAAEQERLRLQKIADDAAAALRAQQVAAVQQVAETEANPQAKKSLLREAVAIAAAPIVSAKAAAPAPVKVAGLSISHGKKEAEIIDLMAVVKAVAQGKLPISVLEPERLRKEHPALDKLAASMGESLTALCAGVKVVEKSSTRGR